MLGAQCVMELLQTQWEIEDIGVNYYNMGNAHEK
jgi:hypothetical protein